MDKINRLTFIREDGRSSAGKKIGLFSCDCGEIKRVIISAVKSENTKSCGCLRIENRYKNIKHGKRWTREYAAWLNMKQRCSNPKVKLYKNYGGRGILVCERWKDSFPDFYADMGDKPSRKHSIERIDVNGNYEPSNCCWIHEKEQARNTTKNRFLTAYGVTICAAEWAEVMEMGIDKISKGIKKGLSDHDCIFRKMKNNGGLYVMAYGIRIKLTEWARVLEINPKRTLERVNKLSWSEHDAIFEKSTCQKNKLKKLAIELKRDFDFDM